MLIIDLVHNIALLVVIVLVHQMVTRHAKRNTAVVAIITGVLYGGICIVGMITPVHFAPGIIFDGRSIILSVAGLFGGPITAVIAAIMSMICRIWIGGAGALMGVSVIWSSAIQGITFHYLRRHNEGLTRPFNLWLFGMSVHIAMLALMYTLPGGMALEVMKKIGPLVIIFYPLATMLVCQVFLDREKQLKSENDLRASEERYRMLFEMANDAIFLHEVLPDDIPGRLLDMNKRACEYLQCAREELLQKTVMDIADDEARREAGRHMANLRENGHATFESAQVRKDGSTFPVEVSAHLVEARGQKQVLSIVRDITERKRNEDALRASEEKFALAFRTSPYAIVITRLSDGFFIEVNDAFVNETGYTRDEVTGRSSREISLWANPKDRERMIHDLRQGESISSQEMLFTKKSGEHMTGLISAQVITLNGEQCILSSINNITEHKRIQETQERLQAQLAQVQRIEAVGRLAGGIAHDFNNIMQAMMGYCQMLLESLPPQNEPHEFAQEILKGVERASMLTSQLLGFARKQTICPQKIDLNDTITATLKMLGRLIGENINLAWKPAYELWPVKADPSQIDQILTNLIVNARDAIHGPGKIIIETRNSMLDKAYCDAHSCYTPGEYVTLSVQDNGIGMDKNTQTLIFEPFFTTKPVGQGTGLGLATVYGIVKQNNGMIDVSSEPGLGTTFHIHLPRYTENAVLPQYFQTPLPTDAGSETILLVEDEEPLLRLAARLIRNLGYTVLTAESPAKAIEMAKNQKEPIHLLMTDVVMPDMSGRELWSELASICPDMKCLFMSGYTADIITSHGILDDGMSFIQKPFSVHALAAKLRQILDHEPESGSAT